MTPEKIVLYEIRVDGAFNDNYKIKLPFWRLVLDYMECGFWAILSLIIGCLLLASFALGQPNYIAYQLVGVPPLINALPTSTNGMTEVYEGSTLLTNVTTTPVASNGTYAVGFWEYGIFPNISDGPPQLAIWLNGLNQPASSCCNINDTVPAPATGNQPSLPLAYALSIDGNGNIIANDNWDLPPYQQPTYYLLVPTTNSLTAQIATLQAQIAILQSQNATLKADFVQLSGEVTTYYAPSIDKYYSWYAACEKKL
ncbi:MAG TPA: hypothetical protein VMS08_03515 [Candidatus Saccharimonadia bacterium]|nr:hypothetical protein [Candidatus Saccharimonadia bacterium]